MAKRLEESLHLRACNHIRHTYPYVEFITDLSGIKMPIGMATKIRLLRSRPQGVSDFLVFEPRGGYKGLFIEFKKDKEVYLKKSGELKAEERFHQQAEFLEIMRCLGYYADFASGWEEIQSTIDEYMKLTPDYDFEKRMALVNKHKQEYKIRMNRKNNKVLDTIMQNPE